MTACAAALALCILPACPVHADDQSKANNLVTPIPQEDYIQNRRREKLSAAESSVWKKIQRSPSYQILDGDFKTLIDPLHCTFKVESPTLVYLHENDDYVVLFKKNSVLIKAKRLNENTITRCSVDGKAGIDPDSLQPYFTCPAEIAGRLADNDKKYVDELYRTINAYYHCIYTFPFGVEPFGNQERKWYVAKVVNRPILSAPQRILKSKIQTVEQSQIYRSLGYLYADLREDAIRIYPHRDFDLTDIISYRTPDGGHVWLDYISNARGGPSQGDLKTIVDLIITSQQNALRECLEQIVERYEASILKAHQMTKKTEASQKGLHARQQAVISLYHDLNKNVTELLKLKVFKDNAGLNHPGSVREGKKLQKEGKFPRTSYKS